MAADRAGVQPELGQILLELDDLVAARAVAENGAARHGGRGRRRGRGRGGRAAGGGVGDSGGLVKRRAGVLVNNAVVLKCVFLLEFLDGGFRLFAVVAGDPRAVELELLERGLDRRDLVRLVAEAVVLRRSARTDAYHQSGGKRRNPSFVRRTNRHTGMRLLSFQVCDYFITSCNICQANFNKVALWRNKKKRNWTQESDEGML